ncbi:MAG: hypothetical protein IT195_02090 [Microthrixaceae bacterium]|nr:hypothetical protein [Microthrixaceae bacterium]
MALFDVTPSLVSPRRFGAALHATRVGTGSTLTAISRRCEGWWTPDELLNVERGSVSLGDASIVSFCRLYALPGRGLGDVASLDLVLDRSESVDLVDAGSAEGSDHLSACRHILVRLCAISRLVGLDAEELADSPVLGEAMDLDAPAIRRSIRELEADGDRIGQVASVLDERVAVPLVGLSIGETPQGVLLLVRRAGGAVRPSPEPVPAAGPLRWFTAAPLSV